MMVVKRRIPFASSAVGLCCAAESEGMVMSALPFLSLPQLNSAPDHQIWGYLVCVGFVFPLCGLWQHRMPAERAGLLETGRMFDMGIFFVSEQKRLKIFSTNTHS